MGLLTRNNATDPVVKSYLDFIYDQRKARWEYVTTLREYDEGDQVTHMTDEQKILLVGADAAGNPNSNPEFSVNICGIILDALVDRLIMTGVRVMIPDDVAAVARAALQGDEQSLSDLISAEVWRWLEQSNMTEGQQIAHRSAARDGDSYPVVEYNADKARPEVTLNQSYNGTTGIEMAYEDGHPNQPLYAVKRWTVQRPVVNNIITNRVRRMNLYFNNRIEYYISEGAAAGSAEYGWRRLRYGDRDFDGDVMEEVMLNDPYNRAYTACVSWLTDDGTMTGKPLGIPVKHMRHNARGNEYGRSRIADVVPGLQDAVNRSELAKQAAALLSGFKEVYILGFFPDQDTDGTSNAIKRQPSAVHYVEGEDGQTLSVVFSEETDLMQLIAVADSYVIKAATLTSTPLSLFNLTAHTPAEGTQKQLESALIVAVEKAQVAFGETWREVVRQMLKYDAAYNEDSLLTPDMIEGIDDWDINIDWADAQTRNESEALDIAVREYKELDVPREVVWERRFGQEEADRYEKLTSVKQNMVLGALAGRVSEIEAENQQAGDQTVTTPAQAGEQLPGNVESDKGLNGAQITAALDILAGVADGRTPAEVAYELLVALGISQDRARRMVDDTQRNRSEIVRAQNGANNGANREPATAGA